MGVWCISLHQRKPMRDRFGFVDPHSLAGRRLLKAGGGAIQGPGPAVAGGMLYLNSGYGDHLGRPGNVLLAFGPE